MLIMYCSEVIFYLLSCVKFFLAASHTLLESDYKLSQCDLLSCANISLIIAIVFLYANHILQQSNVISFANISLL